jgi:hypothetical protein
MKPFKKIAGINLAVLFAYSVLIRALNGGGSHGGAMGIMLMSAVVVGFHVLICLIVSAAIFADKNRELRRAWLLSSGIVLLVGFSTCWGNASW